MPGHLALVTDVFRCFRINVAQTGGVFFLCQLTFDIHALMFSKQTSNMDLRPGIYFLCSVLVKFLLLFLF
jgi:hypothetical protein